MHKQPRLLPSWERENYIFPKVTKMGSPIEAAHTQQKLTQVTLPDFTWTYFFPLSYDESYLWAVRNN